jgi:two-component system CheB/CheR fusion protein
MQDLSGKILAWNPKAVKLYGWSEDEALGMNIRDMIPENDREDAYKIVQKLSQSEVIKPYNMQRQKKDGTTINVSVTSTALRGDNGDIYAIATTERQIK